MLNPDVVLFDERADCAFLGIGYIGANLPVAIYSKQKILMALIITGMSEAEALEYYDWHFTHLNAGIFTPVIFDDTCGD